MKSKYWLNIAIFIFFLFSSCNAWIAIFDSLRITNAFELSDGSLIFVGNSYEPSNPIVIKTNSDGETIFAMEHDSLMMTVYDACLLPDESIICCGMQWIEPDTTPVIGACRIGCFGELRWTHIYTLVDNPISGIGEHIQYISDTIYFIGRESWNILAIISIDTYGSLIDTIIRTYDYGIWGAWWVLHVEPYNDFCLTVGPDNLLCSPTFLRLSHSGETICSTYFGFSLDTSRAYWFMCSSLRGGYFLAGRMLPGPILWEQLALAKVDSCGTILWEKPIPIFMTPEYRVFLFELESYQLDIIANFNFGGPDRFPLLIRCDSLGETLWTKILDCDTLNPTCIYDIVKCSNGDYIICGEYFDTVAYYVNAFIMRIDSLGNSVPTSSVSEKEIPIAPEISAYPNPFNSSCVFSAPDDCEIDIFAIHGRKVATLGENQRIWQPDKNLPAGIYLARVNRNDKSATIRMLFMK